jgi:hypothetical protein
VFLPSLGFGLAFSPWALQVCGWPWNFIPLGYPLPPVDFPVSPQFSHTKLVPYHCCPSHEKKNMVVLWGTIMDFFLTQCPKSMHTLWAQNTMDDSSMFIYSYKPLEDTSTVHPGRFAAMSLRRPVNTALVNLKLAQSDKTIMSLIRESSFNFQTHAIMCYVLSHRQHLPDNIQSFLYIVTSSVKHKLTLNIFLL